MLISQYGSPYGVLPATTGKYLWVSPAATYVFEGQTYAASDNNDGARPDRALRTIAAAIALATASVGDVIALLPGTHTSASAVSINKAGLVFVGVQPHLRDVEGFKPNALATQVNWTSTLAGTAVALSVADCAFIGINFIPVTARTFMTSVTCPRTTFIDCAVTLSAAASTSTKGIVFSGGSSAYVSFVNCVFINTVATSAQGPAVDLTAVANFTMDGCSVLLTGTSSAWAVAIQLGAGSSGLFRNNWLTTQGVGTMTIGVDGTGVAVANAVFFDNNKYGVSPGAGAVKNLTNADGNIVQNFYATIGGGAGFVIQTVTA